eukprot:11180585-Prorocentrum_lima.AAC.1
MSKAGCPVMKPAHMPQFLGLLVDTIADQLVHERNLDLVQNAIHRKAPSIELSVPCWSGASQ